MSAVIGALLDVSGSMQDSIGDGVNEEGGKWAHSIFRVADDLVKYDVSESNLVFVVGVGAKYSEKPFDIITTIMNCKTPEDEVSEIPTAYLIGPASWETIESIFQILEKNGAHTIRRWAKIDTVRYAVSEYVAMIILRKLRNDRGFTRKFVTEYLPLPCIISVGGGTDACVFPSLQSNLSLPVTHLRKGNVEQEIAKAFYKVISDLSEYYVETYSIVLPRCIEKRDQTAYLNESASWDTIESIFQILEKNGAHTIRRWAEIDTVRYEVSEYVALIILRILRTDRGFTRKFVTEYLPLPCIISVCGGTDASVFPALQSTLSLLFTHLRKRSVEQEIAKAFYKVISDLSEYYVETYSIVLPRCIEKRDRTAYLYESASRETIESIFQILEKNGFHTIRIWAEIDTVRHEVSEYVALIILRILRTDRGFTRKFVTKYLPLPCIISMGGGTDASVFPALQSILSLPFTQLQNGNVQQEIAKAFYKCFNDLSEYYVKKTDSNVLPGCIEKRDRTAYLNNSASRETIESIFQILEKNGADSIRKWAEINTVRSAASEYLALIILRKLRTDIGFTSEFVTKYLPLPCRSAGGDTDPSASPALQSNFPEVVLPFLQSILVFTVAPVRKATKGDVEQVIAKAFYKGISKQSVHYVKKVSKVLHGCIEERDLTTERVRELLQLVEPFIYGRTPLYSAINEAATLFHGLGRRYQKYQKLLFILSDGMPTDYGNVCRILTKLREENVTVVSCYISKSSRVEPRKLHSVSKGYWEDGAKFLFDLSSFIPLSSVTRAIINQKQVED